MPITEKASETLWELGLTKYEIKAYVALLDQESRTASQISKYSNIPFSKIYDVLGSLERKGWIVKERSRPSKYYPKPPSLALETAKLRIQSALRSSERHILNELQPLYEKRVLVKDPKSG